MDTTQGDTVRTPQTDGDGGRDELSCSRGAV